MIFKELQTHVLKRLGEDPDAPVYYTAGDAKSALNWANRFFCLLTLCIEDEQAFALSPATAWYNVLPVLPDYLVPLRVSYAGAKVRPARFSELDALDASWQAATGAPQKYAHVGLDLLGIYKQLAGAGSITLTFARQPADLAGDNDVPQAPPEYHPALVDAAIPYLRMKEGGQEFAKVQPLFQDFIEAAKRLGKYVRNRSLDLKYDNLPPELDRVDLSRKAKQAEKRA